METGVHGVGLSVITAHFWTLLWLPLVLPAVSKLPVPTNVTMNADQFNYILKWEPGPGTPTGTYYNVSVGTERGPFDEPVNSCQFVQSPLICDVTEAFPNPREIYIAHVKAHYGHLHSEPAFASRFRPLDHLDLPLLTVTPCDRGLCVDLHPPLKHRTGMYNLSYQFQVETPNKKFVKDVKFLRRVTLNHLAPGQQYCVSVRFADSLENKNSNFSDPVCVFTSGWFPTDAVISTALCLLVIAAVVIFILLIDTGYINLKKRRLPSVLSAIDHKEEVLIIRPCSTSSFLNVWPTHPSAEEKSCRTSSSDESDEDCTTGSISRSSNRAYQKRLDTYLIASSSSLSESYAPKPKLLPSFSPNQLPDIHSKSTKFLTENIQSDRLIRERFEESKKEHDIMDSGKETTIQDVNLHTLTFGRREEVETLPDTAQGDTLDGSEDPSPVTSSQTAADWCVDEEEEEMDSGSGYMGRPLAMSGRTA